MTPRTPNAGAIGSEDFTSTLRRFIYGDSIRGSGTTNWKNVNDIVLHALSAISMGDRNGFLEALGHIEDREPSVESDWIYNDGLLFAFLVGVKRFGVESPWIEKTLEVRTEQTSGISHDVGKTMLKVLHDEDAASDLYHPLVIVIRHLLDLSPGDNERLNETYESLVRGRYDEFDSPLSTVVHQRAKDVIVLSKGLSDFDVRRAEERFRQRFTSVVHQVAVVIQAMVASIALASMGVFAYLYITLDEAQFVKFARGTTLLGMALSGFSIYKVVFDRAGTIKKVEDKILSFFRFPESAAQTSE